MEITSYQETALMAIFQVNGELSLQQVRVFAVVGEKQRRWSKMNSHIHDLNANYMQKKGEIIEVRVKKEFITLKLAEMFPNYHAGEPKVQDDDPT